MNELISFLQYRLRRCKESNSHEAKQNFFHQAFGGVEFYSQIHPFQEEEIRSLWEEWREKFIHEIWD